MAHHSDDHPGSGPPVSQDDLDAALIRIEELTGRITRAEQDASGRAAQQARDHAASITKIRADLDQLASRARQADERLTESTALMTRLSSQLATAPAKPGRGDTPGKGEEYQPEPGPPWWRAGDPDAGIACASTTARLRDWVHDIYRPVYGHLAARLPACWDQHPLCLAILDVLHEAWCLLYLPGTERDARTVLAQLDWLTRPLIQATDIMAADTRSCTITGHHQPPEPRIPA